VRYTKDIFQVSALELLDRQDVFTVKRSVTLVAERDIRINSLLRWGIS
jgi:hypothetical protein